MTAIEDAVKLLDQWGVWSIVLPFILVFTLVYATLERTRVFGTEDGEPKHRYNAMVAFVLGFFVIAYVQVLDVINLIAQYMVIIIIVIITLSVILGLVGFKGIKKNISLAVSLVIFSAIALYAFGYLGIISLPALRQFFEAPFVVILVMLVLVWLIMRPSGEAPTKHEQVSEKQPAKAPGKPSKPSAPSKEAPEEAGGEEVPEEEMPEERREPTAKAPVKWRLKESIPKEKLRKRR